MDIQSNVTSEPGFVSCLNVAYRRIPVEMCSVDLSPAGRACLYIRVSGRSQSLI